MVDGSSLSMETVLAAAHDESVEILLSKEARRRCEHSRAVVERILDGGRAVYGINTGFGELARITIPREDVSKLQENLVRSHAIGTGAPLPRPIVRGALLLRAHTLAKGHSGVRPVVIEALINLLNAGICPLVPEKGSLGASGDLAPLAHMALVLLGEGKAFLRDGRCVDGAEALRQAGLQPIRLEAKEGLALINGTPVMCAIALETLARGALLLKTASMLTAMSTEALRGTDKAFDARIHRLRPHKGQLEAARHLRAMMRGSRIRRSHLECGKVQDPYSIRCAPQVLGACFDAWEHVRRVVEIEMDSVTDNPLVFEDEVISGGNFHGEPVGLAMDYLCCALAEVGSISERRTFRLLTEHLSGLPAFLTTNSGLNSGFMIAQYTAASLVSENKVLCHPAVVDSIPSSADQEDHVSMGTISSRKALAISRNLADILALEYLCAAQALDLLSPLEPGKGVRAAWRELRREVRPLEEDRCMYEDLIKAREVIESGRAVEAADEAVGFRWRRLVIPHEGS